MKKFFLCMVSIFLWIGLSFGYHATTGDDQALSLLKTSLLEATPKSLFGYNTQLQTFQKVLGGNDEKLDYYLRTLVDYGISVFDKRKSLARQNAKSEKQAMLDQYQSHISLEGTLYENCIWWYNTLDNMSFANDFPTALTIAVWFRESTCGYYLPKNGDGPFQIVSKDYGTWEITEEIFKQSIQDFFDFAKGKINRYNSKNDADHQINLTYTHATFADLLKFSALYNGLDNGEIKGDILPKSLKYFFEGYDSEYWTGESKKFWIFAQYLKVLEREVKLD